MPRWPAVRESATNSNAFEEDVPDHPGRASLAPILRDLGARVLLGLRSPLLGRYLIPAFSDWLLVTVGSLDHPERTPPQRHFGIESQLPWLAIHDDLLRERYQERFIESQVDEAASNPSGIPEGWRWGDGLS